MNVINTLNNREIAVLMWSFVVFLWALSSGPVRRSFRDLLKTFCHKKIVIPFVMMLCYVLALGVILEKVGFWDISATKDTVLWIVGTAFVTFFSLSKVAHDEAYFKRAIFDNFKFVLILEFIVALYSFDLIIELILVLIVTVIVLLKVIAESKPEYRQVKVFLDYALGLLGIALIVFTLREVVVDFQNVVTLKNIRDFFLPVVFTVTFLPFVYLMALYMQYETLFIRVDFFNTNRELARYAKQKILTTCHVNLSKLNRFSKNVGSLTVDSKEDVLILIRKALGN
jgi:hypothetical protein